jgi:tryptophan synthase beta chain
MADRSEMLAGPGGEGWFGPYGGRFVPETLIPALEELVDAWGAARQEEGFQTELDQLLRDYAGRPTPLYRAERLGEHLGGVRVWLKREDLCHTGAHKINNTVGQALLARRMGKRRIIAETGAGQHGVATATACALLGFRCVVYMGEEDMRRQSLNVERMRRLGAGVRSVGSGTGTRKDATNEAIRDWVESVETTHYIIGSVVGPAPYPEIVRDFQRVIGDEAHRQLADRGVEASAVLACVGGGSNSIGIFTQFLDRDDVELIGVEAAGEGIASGRHSASLSAGIPGVLHGSYSYLLQDEDGQVVPAHSVSAGLDYPGVGPEHSRLRDTGRVRYESVTDDQALQAFQDLCRLEGIIPALESAHALAELEAEKERWRGHDVLVCLSGRGDKDVGEVARLLSANG